MKNSAIPSYYLYGEQPKDVEFDFLHLEKVKDRSAPLFYNIRPHRHTALNHILFIKSGSGTISADGQNLKFTDKCIIWVPKNIVHGFKFAENTDGFVLTIADSYLDTIIKNARNSLDLGAIVKLAFVNEEYQYNNLLDWFEKLSRELSWKQAAQKFAVEACLIGIFIEFHRLELDNEPTIANSDNLSANIMARFRQLIETHFKENFELRNYLEKLKITEAQLRYACTKFGESSVMNLILKRRLLEAKRLLIYSDMQITEISHSVGFEDSAYFSRIFAKYENMSPREYRIANNL